MAEDKNKNTQLKKLNVADFISNKSVKLSDAYKVIIKQVGNASDDDDDDIFKGYGKSDDGKFVGEEMYNCVAVRLPAYKPNTNEVVKYANKSIKMKMNNFEDVETLSLTFWETADRSIYQMIKSMTKINGMSENLKEPTASYNPWRFIDEIDVNVLDNALSAEKPILVYKFKRLTLVNYSYDYQLDYTANSLPLVTLEFNYKSYSVEV